MFVFILFIFLLLGAGAGILFLNKGDRAQEIKDVLIKIGGNFKDLFENIKHLFTLIQKLIPEGTTTPLDDPTSSSSPVSTLEDINSESETITSEPEISNVQDLSSEEQSSTSEPEISNVQDLSSEEQSSTSEPEISNNQESNYETWLKSEEKEINPPEQNSINKSIDDSFSENSQTQSETDEFPGSNSDNEEKSI